MLDTIAVNEDTFVVVSDGATARGYQATIDSGRVNVRGLGAIKPKDAQPSRKSSAPRRWGFSDDAGPGADATPETFAHRLGQQLNVMAAQNEFRSLVVIADRNTLSQLHRVTSDSVEERLIAEVDQPIADPSEDQLASLFFVL